MPNAAAKRPETIGKELASPVDGSTDGDDIPPEGMVLDELPEDMVELTAIGSITGAYASQVAIGEIGQSL